MNKEHLKVKISELKPNPKNPKLHDDELIKDSIKDLGFVDDIVIDEKNIILSGHGRLKALQELGTKEVDVIRITGWTQEQKDRYLLLSNKSVEKGGWDFELLSKLDEDLLREVGFMSEELDKIFKDLNKNEDEIPEISEKTISKLGDIYQLGDHRLVCGDATKREDVDKLMDGKKANMVFTDPPYGVNFKYNKYDDNKTKEQHKEFCGKWLDIIKQFSDFIVITIGFSNERIFYELDKEFNWVIWFKKFAVSASKVAFARRTEPVFILGKPPKRRYDTDFFEYGTDREKGLNKKHPCPKPIALMEAFIVPQTDRGGIVLDIFLGSGSTLIACEKTNRICYGMELDPKYCDVIIKRWENFTKLKAKKL